MKFFAVIRHGNHDDDGRIDDVGRRQMSRLAGLLEPHLEGHHVRFLVSPAPRATDSAEVLMKELGRREDYKSSDRLWCDDDHPENVDDALELLLEESTGVDVLVVVTHAEYAALLPTEFAKASFGARGSIFPMDVEKGRGRIIDCDRKVAVFL